MLKESIWETGFRRSCYRARLPPLWPGIDAAPESYVVEFVVGSHVFFFGFSGFSAFKKTNTLNSSSTRIEDPREIELSLMLNIVFFIYHTLNILMLSILISYPVDRQVHVSHVLKSALATKILTLVLDQNSASFWYTFIFTGCSRLTVQTAYTVEISNEQGWH